MATQTPFSFLEDFFKKLPTPNFEPPAWAQVEVRRRVVLLLNHVLGQEPQALSRLLRQKGQVALVQWRKYAIALEVTPAGLLDLAEPAAKPDLVITVVNELPMALAQDALRGVKPAVRIEGDVQLAAEVSWLVEHVRWDLEDDLARIIGDAPAHVVGDVSRAVANALKSWLARVAPAQAGDAASGDGGEGAAQLRAGSPRSAT